MKPEPIILPFRGDRNYLHGTTLFSLVQPPDGSIDLVFRINRPMTVNCVRLIYDVPEARLNSFPCTLTWSLNGEARNLTISEYGAIPSLLRAPYDDSSFTEWSTLTGDALTLERESGLDFIETTVALNKVLLKTLFPPIGKIQYVFTRIELNFVPADFLPIRLQFFRRVGTAHFISQIFIKEKHVGMIHFSQWTYLW